MTSSLMNSIGRTGTPAAQDGGTGNPWGDDLLTYLLLGYLVVITSYLRIIKVLKA